MGRASSEKVVVMYTVRNMSVLALELEDVQYDTGNRDIPGEQRLTLLYRHTLHVRLNLMAIIHPGQATGASLRR
jgi:hypothetical protein